MYHSSVPCVPRVCPRRQVQREEAWHRRRPPLADVFTKQDPRCSLNLYIILTRRPFCIIPCVTSHGRTERCAPVRQIRHPLFPICTSLQTHVKPFDPISISSHVLPLLGSHGNAVALRPPRWPPCMTNCRTFGEATVPRPRTRLQDAALQNPRVFLPTTPSTTRRPDTDAGFSLQVSVLSRIHGVHSTCILSLRVEEALCVIPCVTSGRRTGRYARVGQIHYPLFPMHAARLQTHVKPILSHVHIPRPGS